MTSTKRQTEVHKDPRGHDFRPESGNTRGVDSNQTPAWVKQLDIDVAGGAEAFDGLLGRTSEELLAAVTYSHEPRVIDLAYGRSGGKERSRVISAAIANAHTSQETLSRIQEHLLLAIGVDEALPIRELVARNRARFEHELSAIAAHPNHPEAFGPVSEGWRTWAPSIEKRWLASEADRLEGRLIGFLELDGTVLEGRLKKDWNGQPMIVKKGSRTHGVLATTPQGVSSGFEHREFVILQAKDSQTGEVVLDLTE